MPTDEELVTRSLAGEVSAFTQLVEKHQRHVFAVALSSVRDAASAEDVAQEAFVEAWHDLPRLRDRTRVASWIAGIARNLARRWHRRKARRVRRETATQEPSDTATPLDVMLERETSSVLGEALAELPAAHRESLILFYVHGRSIADVAAALGVSEDVVKQRLSRGRRGLRDRLESEIEGALSRAKPGAGFTALVAASVAATSRRAAAGTSAGKVLLLMKSTKAAVAIVLIAAGVAVLLFSRGNDARAPTAESPLAASPALGPGSRVNELAGPAARTRLLEQIRAARLVRDTEAKERAASAPSERATGSSENTPDEDEDRDYIQLAMGDVLPSVMECYEAARKLEPGLAGTLVVNFTIEGEPGVGGLVTDATIDAEQSEIKDAALGDCVREAVFSLEIEPPTSGVAKVTYPFTFGRP